jgi:hypothetical protein
MEFPSLEAWFGRNCDYMQLLGIVKIDAAASNGVRDGDELELGP